MSNALYLVRNKRSEDKIGSLIQKYNLELCYDVKDEKVLKNENILLLLKKSFNRFLIISLDVLICRYSPLLRAFPALFISEEPHKSFYYPSCFHSQK